MNGENTIEVNGKTIHVKPLPLPNKPGLHNGQFTAITDINNPHRTLPPGLHAGVFTPVISPETGTPGLHNGVFTPLVITNKTASYGEQADEALKNEGGKKDEKSVKPNGTEKAILIFVIIILSILFIPCCVMFSSSSGFSSMISGSGSYDAASTALSEEITNKFLICSEEIEDRVDARRDRLEHWVNEIVGPIEEWADKVDNWINEIPSWENTIDNWSNKASHWANIIEDAGGGGW